MVAILENYQTNNKTVVIPNVLRKYMGDIKEIKST
jgi:seryl-tRNA synthetase